MSRTMSTLFDGAVQKLVLEIKANFSPPEIYHETLLDVDNHVVLLTPSSQCPIQGQHSSLRSPQKYSCCLQKVRHLQTVRYEEYHSWRDPSTTYHLSLFRRTVWSTLSKAFEKSV
ncbi:hypothetical protein J6590_086258 [Homalodisca vitripennis]|nr:hypothetical protein J6590_086258 [Homalodisca vitripennis]